MKIDQYHRPPDLPDLSRYYDLAVVGAGPAGSMAAALAAGAGLSVILLEKQGLPREKTCGGLVSARALSMLPPGLELPPPEGNPIREVRVYRRGKRFSFSAEKTLGVVMRRSHFDLMLVRHARSCGAAVLEESPLLNLSRQPDIPGKRYLYRLECGGAAAGQPCYARFVIGADGVRSSCAVLAGLRQRPLPRPIGWGWTTFAAAPPEQEQPSVSFYPLPFRGGLGWSFPGPGWVNRGVGGLAGPAALKKEYRRIFPDGQEKMRLWPLPFTGPVKRAARDNLLLIGDAAGLVDPFSGEGIYNAMHSACLAAHSIIAAALDSRRSAADIYSPLFRSHFRKGFSLALLGAMALHTRFLTAPQALPPAIASIMTNNHWSGRSLPEELWDARHHQ